MHHYHRLQNKLEMHPVGAPKTNEILEILELLFNEEEIELAVLLEFRLKRASEISCEAQKPLEYVLNILESLADRGVILAKNHDGEQAYALFPTYPGLFEYPFMKGGESETQQKLAKLWHEYYMKAMAAELANARPPWNRIIPVEEALNEEFEILPFEVASQMIAQAENIAVANCPCRITAGNCEKPLDVCLSFDGAARYLTERGIARSSSLENALDILKKSEKAGLVHTGSNNAGKLLFLCNCCPCCCHFLRLITEHKFSEAVAKSSYYATVDPYRCSGCGKCITYRCPIGAIVIKEEVSNPREDVCIGCGLCVSTCPEEAITLRKRTEHENPPATIHELIKKIVAHKRDSKR
jgi:Na+-translocating ferredoxin:NAD+ oxidoreductase subunit B